jgi:hypothetical protein
MILTDKDARALQHNTNFKSVELNEKYLNISVRNILEGENLEREIQKYQQSQDVDPAQDQE